MADPIPWTRCSECGLRHSVTLSATCPRCGAFDPLPGDVDLSAPTPVPLARITPIAVPAVTAPSTPPAPSAPAARAARPRAAPAAPPAKDEDLAAFQRVSRRGAIARWTAAAGILAAGLVVLRGCTGFRPAPAYLGDEAVLLPAAPGVPGLPDLDRPVDGSRPVLHALDTVLVLEEREDWARVRAASGQEGFVQLEDLIPAEGTRLAVALRPGACYRTPMGAPEPGVQPGAMLFLRGRYLGWWTTAGDPPGCPWVKEGFFSLSPDDVQVGAAIQAARRLPTAAERDEALARIAAEHPGVEAVGLITSPAGDARATRL